MTIIVRKPFEPEPFEGKNRGVKVHPEFEEKPVVESITQSSEDAHGGSELTFSLPNSSQSSGQENSNTVNNQANQNNTSAFNAGTSNTDVDTNDQGTQDGSTSVTDNETKQGQGNEENGDEVGDAQEQNSENGNEGEDTNEQSQSGVYNIQQVVDVTSGNINNAKYYQTEFWRFIELIAEEKTRTFDPMGSDEYNVRKLMFRQFERKSLGNYKMSRVRESVVIVLDNSGSMQWWAGNLAILAELAMQRNDVEVYLAPNGHIEEMIYPRNQLVNHDEVVRGLRNRKIIYVGDFDGADTPIILSWYNDVIWICPEERYLNFLEHDWVHYDEGEFRGAFLRVFTLGEMFNAFRRLLSNPNLRLWYDLCNESHKCGGDEGA
jgi:hypothetical protein